MELSTIFLTETNTNLDKIKTMTEKGYLDKTIDKIINFGIDLILALLVWIVGSYIIKGIMKILDHWIEKAKVEISVAQFMHAFAKAAMKVVLLIIVITIIGIKSSSLVALIGSAGVTIGLALQGSLSNFAGGVLILLVKPFKVGDYIIEKNNNNEGTVTSIDIFYTRLLTFDNKMVVIPNGALSNSSIINATNETIRRLDINVLIDYSENITKVKDILLQLVNENELVLKENEINVFVSSFDPSAINIGMRVWVLQENYWILKWEMLERIKNEFDNNDIRIPYDQLDVNITNKAEK